MSQSSIFAMPRGIFMPAFSEILKKLRQERGVTQGDLAAYLHVTPRTIRFYETGERKPDFEGLLALADYFDISLDQLVGRTKSSSSCQDKIFPVAEAVKQNAVFSAEAREMIELLQMLLSDADPDIRAWTRVQFRHAFDKYLTPAQCEKKAHA